MEADPITVSPSLTVDTFASQLLDGESPLTAVPLSTRMRSSACSASARSAGCARQWATTRVADVMVKPPKLSLLAPSGLMKDGLEQIHKAGVDGLPVVEDGKLVGMLTRLGVGTFIRARQAESTPAK